MTREQAGKDRAGRVGPVMLVTREQLVETGLVWGQFFMNFWGLGFLLLLGGLVVRVLQLYYTHTSPECWEGPQCRLCFSRGLHWGFFFSSNRSNID